MGAPNRSDLVFELADRLPELLEQNTADSILQFMMELGQELAAEDPNWGFLTKDPGEKHLVHPSGIRIAVDSFCYKPTLEVIDCLTNAVEVDGESKPTWIHKERRPNNQWLPIKVDAHPSNGNGNNEDLQRQIDELKAQFAAFMAQRPVVEGSIISLRSENIENPHPWVCADGNQGNRLIANRDVPNSWERFCVKVK
jgi:hypothetical protein